MEPDAKKQKAELDAKEPKKGVGFPSMDDTDGSFNKIVFNTKYFGLEDEREKGAGSELDAKTPEKGIGLEGEFGYLLDGQDKSVRLK